MEEKLENLKTVLLKAYSEEDVDRVVGVIRATITEKKFSRRQISFGLGRVIERNLEAFDEDDKDAIKAVQALLEE